MQSPPASPRSTTSSRTTSSSYFYSAAADLREGLFSSLRKSGTVDSLKAQVRAKVIHQLRLENEGLLQQKQEHDNVENEADRLERRVAHSLIVDYLKSTKCPYTLSVFMPEGGLEDSEPLSRDEIQRLISMDKENTSSNSKEQPVLMDLVSISSSPSTLGGFRLQSKSVKDCETQTLDGDSFQGDSATLVLERKLTSVSNRYSILMEREALQPKKTIEERMIRYQRECDKRAESMIQAEVSRFCATELANMRTKERTMLRREMAREKENLHREHCAKLKQLSERETQMSEQVQRREAEIEAKLYQERQTLLKKIESIGTKGDQDRRALELDRRLLKEKETKCSEKLQELERKTMELSKLETELRLKYEEQTRTYRQSVLGDFEERERRLQREEIRVREEVAVLTRQQQESAAKLAAASDMSTSLQDANEKLQQLRSEREELLLKVKTFDNQIEFVKTTAEHDRMRYDKLYAQHVNVTKELETVRAQYDQMMSADFGREREELISKLRDRLADVRVETDEKIRELEIKLSEVSFERDQEVRMYQERMERNEMTYKGQNADLRDKLYEAEQQVNDLLSKNEESLALARSLEAENVDLRKLLQQSRRALDEQLNQTKEDRQDSDVVAAAAAAPVVPPPAYYYPPQQFMTSQVQLQPQPNAQITQQLTLLQQQLETLAKSNETKYQEDALLNLEHTRPRKEEKPRKLYPPKIDTSIKSPHTATSSGIRSPRSAKSLTSNKSSPKSAKGAIKKPSLSPPAIISPRRSPKSVGAQSSPKQVSPGPRISPRQLSARPKSPKRSPLSAKSAASSYIPSPLSGRTKSPLSAQRRSPSSGKRSPLSSSSKRSPLSSSSKRSPLSSNSKRSPLSSNSKRSPLSGKRSPDSESKTPLSGKRSPLSATKSPRSGRSSLAAKLSPSSSGQKESKFVSDKEDQDAEESEEDETSAILLHRAAQDRQRKLQQQRQKERQRLILEAEEKRRLEQEQREEQRKLEIERVKRAEEEAAKAKEMLERQKELAEEAEKKRQNDSIIQQYREKAMQKLATTKKDDSGSDSDAQTSGGKISPASTLSKGSLLGSEISVGGDDDASAGPKGSDDDSDGWGF